MHFSAFVHAPRQDAGYRLSRSDLVVAYNQTVEFQDPIVSIVRVVKLPISLTLLKKISNYEIPMDFKLVVKVLNVQMMHTLWMPTTTSSNNALTIKITVSSTCTGQLFYGLCYLWRETSCPFKRAAPYNYIDPNLSSLPYIKLFQ